MPVTSRARFPHYTWGYIAEKPGTFSPYLVPSLYVRVYRWLLLSFQVFLSSLTIREGISLVPAVVMMHSRFPHYTWGYIGRQGRGTGTGCVPSLYVRVYRQEEKQMIFGERSLTIREGISRCKNELTTCRKFHHYTWGYIICRFPHLSFLGVPSLYVRVYRSSRCTIRQNPRSITIREGISLSLRETSLVSLFPHYTWGYIEKKCKKRRKNCVPSLYVRVYWSFSLLSESLILKM